MSLNPVSMLEGIAVISTRICDNPCSTDVIGFSIKFFTEVPSSLKKALVVLIGC